MAKKTMAIPDEISFNKYGAEQKTRKFQPGSAEYDALDALQDERWEAYCGEMCSRGVTVEYDLANDQYVVKG